MKKIEDDEGGIVSGETVCGYCIAVHADVDDHEFATGPLCKRVIFDVLEYKSHWFHPSATGRASVAGGRKVEVSGP